MVFKYQLLQLHLVLYSLYVGIVAIFKMPDWKQTFYVAEEGLVNPKRLAGFNF